MWSPNLEKGNDDMCTLGFWKDDEFKQNNYFLEKQEHVVYFSKISYLNVTLKGTFIWSVIEIWLLCCEKHIII